MCLDALKICWELIDGHPPTSLGNTVMMMMMMMMIGDGHPLTSLENEVMMMMTSDDQQQLLGMQLFITAV